MTHQRIILSGPTVDGAWGLPTDLRGLDDATLADLPAALDPVPAAYAGVGYWRIAEPDPLPANTVETGRTVEIVDGQAKWVLATDPAPLEPRKAEMKAAVDAERDQRIDGSFVFGGVVYQSRPEDRENMGGAATAALGAMMSGAQPGDLRWHGGASDFAWIAADNSENPMDAQTMYALGLAGMAHKQAHIFAGRAIKDAIDAAQDHAALDTIDIMAGWPS